MLGASSSKYNMSSASVTHSNMVWGSELSSFEATPPNSEPVVANSLIILLASCSSSSVVSYMTKYCKIEINIIIITDIYIPPYS